MCANLVFFFLQQKTEIIESEDAAHAEEDVLKDFNWDEFDPAAFHDLFNTDDEKTIQMETLSNDADNVYILHARWFGQNNGVCVVCIFIFIVCIYCLP